MPPSGPSATKDPGLPIQERLQCFRDHSAQCIENSYDVEHNRFRSSSGTLSTSLVQDVFSLLRTEAKLLVELLTEFRVENSRTGAVMYSTGLQYIFGVVKQVQANNRLLFLTSLEDSCAAANNYYKMAECMENFIDESILLLPALKDSADLADIVIKEGNSLVAMFSQDAVSAAERTQVFIIREVHKTSIPTDYFGKAWEDEWTDNDVSLSLIRIFDEYLTDIETYLANDYLYSKALVISAKAMTCFYVRCLVNKADAVTRRRRTRERFYIPGDTNSFKSYERAVRRISDDINILSEFYDDRLAGNNTLMRIISDEMYVLDIIIECLRANDLSSLDSFILVIHKRTGADLLVTRYFIGDLWILMSNKRGRTFIRNTMEKLQPDLQLMTNLTKERTVEDTDELTFVRLDAMLKAMYEDRVAQGVLPACWHFLPKQETEVDSVVAKQIRDVTRKFDELKSKPWELKHKMSGQFKKSKKAGGEQLTKKITKLKAKHQKMTQRIVEMEWVKVDTKASF